MSEPLAPQPTLAEMIAFNQRAMESSDGVGVSVTFLRNFTIEGIQPVLAYHCLQEHLCPSIAFGEYDNVLQELLDRESIVHRHPADLTAIALLVEGLDPRYGEPGWTAARAKEVLQAILDAAAASGRLFLVNTFIPPFDADCGIAAPAGLPERGRELLALNEVVRSFVDGHPDRFLLVDWERLARIHGEQGTMDYRFWYMSKAPFKLAFLDGYAREIVKVLRALKGRNKKCLLLDCDNTLWGGVVGEDGLAGIRLDRHTHPGNIYRDFQKQALRLHARGVLLALVSKNDEGDVWDVLDHHPDCLLKRDHLAAWRINWDEKAGNIEQLARDLNLGLDSFVFVDDSPVECEWVRTRLPEVTVIQVPAKLHLLPGILAREGLFDTLTLSAEDRQRSAMYREESQRKQAAGEFRSVEEYLASLGLVVTVHPAKQEEFARIAQLTQKTNQFNLTTRRYSAAQIEELAQAADTAVLSLGVRDRFGNSGLTGVLIARRDGETARIDSLLLSCRVLGRNVESVFLGECLARLRTLWAVADWEAEFIPTRKNGQTASFFDRMGFHAVRKDDAGVRYRVSAAQWAGPSIPYITVEE